MAYSPASKTVILVVMALLGLASVANASGYGAYPQATSSIPHAVKYLLHVRDGTCNARTVNIHFASFRRFKQAAACVVPVLSSVSGVPTHSNIGTKTKQFF